MSVDPQIKFNRARKGYDPEEVDAAFEKMQRELRHLKRENRHLTQNMEQYDIRLGQLAESTKLLEEEWARESRRLAEMIPAAQRQADEIIAHARWEAGRITAQARMGPKT